ncbi:MAG: TIM barrel protein [Rhizobiales bacterium]|nr:TIM barrel protein [Hyphomicrobiales bacterium]
MGFSLSLNLNPLVNRFAEPEDLIAVLADEIGIGHIQLVHEFINPAWDTQTVSRLTARMAKACASKNVKVTSLMTGPYGRLNHFAHPDPAVRDYYVRWFKGMADVAGGLGAPTLGTQYGIFTYKDFDDPRRRNELMQIALDCWRAVGIHAKSCGLTWLFWESMSVGREIGHTIDSAKELQDWIDAAALPIPLKPLIDIDHGDVSSSNPRDIDPFAWAREFATRSPIIHIKQSSMNKGGHWPFTAQYNKDGRITPEKLIAAIREGGGANNELCLELAFREREPTDRNVVSALKESVAYWAPYTNTGYN